MSNIITYAGYFGTAIGTIISIYYAFKYNNIKSLKNTIDVLKQENETLNNLIKAKDKTISEFKNEVIKLETRMNRQAIQTEGKILEINRKIDQLEEENRLHKIENAKQSLSVTELKEALGKAIDHCESTNCFICKELKDVLIKY